MYFWILISRIQFNVIKQAFAWFIKLFRKFRLLRFKLNGYRQCGRASASGLFQSLQDPLGRLLNDPVGKALKGLILAGGIHRQLAAVNVMENGGDDVLAFAFALLVQYLGGPVVAWIGLVKEQSKPVGIAFYIQHEASPHSLS